MHYSQGSAGLGHSSVGCVLSVCGSGRVCPSSSSSRPRFALTGIPDPQGAVASGSNTPWRGQVHCLAPESPLFREMPTEPEAFLGMLGVSGPRPCAWTHQKIALCYTRLVGGTEDKYRYAIKLSQPNNQSANKTNEYVNKMGIKITDFM